jgi:hypothetical protein
MTVISDALRIELVWLYHEASSKMARTDFGRVASIDRTIDQRPFIEGQVAGGEVTYAVWIDRGKPHEIDCLLLAGSEHNPRHSGVPKRTVVPAIQSSPRN